MFIAVLFIIGALFFGITVYSKLENSERENDSLRKNYRALEKVCYLQSEQLKAGEKSWHGSTEGKSDE